MSRKSRAEFDELRSLAFGSISGTYANVGAATDEPVSAFRVTNNTNGDLIVSVDGGTTDHLFVASGSFVLYDVRSNKNTGNQDNFVLPTGTQFAVKQSTAPSEGAVYIDVLHDAP